MKILVLSDSHGLMGFMRRCMDAVQPDAVIHLGDMVCDADQLSAENPKVPFYQVAGNCDAFRVKSDYPEILVENFCGVRVFMVHGHRHGVKTFLGKLMDSAHQSRADVVLYGHTHMEDCRREDDGVWVMNPGSAGFGSTAGILQLTGKEDITCKIIHASDLEEQTCL